MITPNKEKFIELTKQGNLIPIYKEIKADIDTPLSAFVKIDDGKYSYLLESIEGGEKIGRYCFLGSSPELIFKSKGKKIDIIKRDGRKLKKISFDTNTDPLDEIKKIMSEYKYVANPDLPRFSGGLVGYMGYDAVRFFEKLPDKNPDDLKLPDSCFMLTDTILIFDRIFGKVKIVSNVHVASTDPKEIERCYEKATRKIYALEEKLDKSLSGFTLRCKKTGRLVIKSNFTPPKFAGAVNKIKSYIRRGDIIQAVLSQRFSTKCKQDPLVVYRKLRAINPSPYMYFLKLDDFTIVGSSPELLVRCENGRVETRPIAGTRKRGKTPLEDEKLMQELLKDPKERAEHLMLVDLGRNDIGRVSQLGSVNVDEFMIIEKYSHVMHIVSNCSGKLASGKDSFDVMRAAFPAGTVSGAPKIRAMEIIDEVENLRRGPYAGSISYFSFSGNLDSCITIRTIIIKDKIAHVQAGAGIVADSEPDLEYKETQNKARAMLKALEES